jgi:hypothetical protein
LVFPLTCSSRLNWIQAEFAALRYFVPNGTEHRSPAERDTAIGDYIRWRNQRARFKTGYATNCGRAAPSSLSSGSGAVPRAACFDRLSHIGRHYRFSAMWVHSIPHYCCAAVRHRPD